MDLFNLRVDDIILHTIHDTDLEGNRPDPTLSSTTFDLGPEAHVELVKRITEVAGSRSKAVEMDIRTAAPRSAITVIDPLSGCDTDSFVAGSQDLARLLHFAQRRGSIPGGVCVVLRGVSGETPLPVVAILKADVHRGFRLQADNSAELLDGLFLSKSANLYKVALFRSNPNSRDESPITDKWDCMVYDSAYVDDRGAGAIYFFDDFLGLSISMDTEWLNKRFYRLVSDYFAGNGNLSLDDQVEFDSALLRYATNSNAGTISVADFADTVLPLDMRDNFQAFMATNKFPLAGITRMPEAVHRLAEKRNYQSVDRRILLRAPADALNTHEVTITDIPARDGSTDTWTEIIVKRPLVKGSR